LRHASPPGRRREEERGSKKRLPLCHKLKKKRGKKGKKRGSASLFTAVKWREPIEIQGGEGEKKEKKVRNH